MSLIAEIFFNLNEWLQHLTAVHPLWAYMIFFLIVFAESAFFPVAPVLPGDGMLFAVGVLAFSGSISLWVASVVLITGGIVGNRIAYFLGRRFGPALFDRFRWLDQNDYRKANEFYAIYGSRALFYSRFVPVVRALVPLVAGVASMDLTTFTKYNILSVSLWVVLLLLSGYFLGHIPWVKANFLWLIPGMVLVSILPAIVLFFIRKLRKQ